MSLTVVLPATITPAMVTANTLAETLPTWAAGTTYADKARVVGSDGASVFESLQAGNVGHDPLAEDLTAPVWWDRVGASNRFALFDGEASLPSTATSSFSVTVRPGPVGAIGLLGMSGISSVRAQVRDLITGLEIYAREEDLLAEGIDTPLEFFYSWPRVFASERAWVDMPVFSMPEVTLTFGGTGALSLGEVVLGMPYQLGETVRGATFGMNDYSRTERDRWGRLTFAPGDFSRAPSVPFIFPSERFPKVVALLRRFRGRPCLYVPSQAARLSPFITYGVYQRLRVDMQTLSTTYASLDLEGVAETN